MPRASLGEEALQQHLRAAPPAALHPSAPRHQLMQYQMCACRPLCELEAGGRLLAHADQRLPAAAEVAGVELVERDQGGALQLVLLQPLMQVELASVAQCAHEVPELPEHHWTMWPRSRFEDEVLRAEQVLSPRSLDVKILEYVFGRHGARCSESTALPPPCGSQNWLRRRIWAGRALLCRDFEGRRRPLATLRVPRSSLHPHPTLPPTPNPSLTSCLNFMPTIPLVTAPLGGQWHCQVVKRCLALMWTPRLAKPSHSAVKRGRNGQACGARAAGIGGRSRSLVVSAWSPPIEAEAEMQTLAWLGRPFSATRNPETEYDCRALDAGKTPMQRSNNSGPRGRPYPRKSNHAPNTEMGKQECTTVPWG